MACFTKTQQRNGTNCEFEKYVTTINFFMLNQLDKSHLNSACIQCVCDKSEKARACAKWQRKSLDWCYRIAFPASPILQSCDTVSCVSQSFRAHPCVLAIGANVTPDSILKALFVVMKICTPRYITIILAQYVQKLRQDWSQCDVLASVAFEIQTTSGPSMIE